MLRIGLLLDSMNSSAWIASLVEQLQASEFARVELVVLNTPPLQVRPPLKKRLQNYWKSAVYHRYEQWDYKRNKGKADAKAPAALGPLLEGVPVLQVDPRRKGFSDFLSDEDVAAVRAADLDVLLRFGFRILKGGILEAARYGIWSFHHDDNLQYRGGPPLFWEVFDGNPVSGTILQILTSSLDGGKVLYRGHSATNRHSLYLNRNPVYWKTVQYMLRRLRDLDTRGWAYIQALPTYNETEPLPQKIHRTPNAWQMAQFLWRIFTRRARASLFSRTHGGFSQWFLAIRRRSEPHGFSDAAGYALIRPPADRFYADPNLVTHEGRTWLFFEDYVFADHRALISCCEVMDDGTTGEVFEVLRRPYHLSYPFVFEDEGGMYMIPETRENGTVELYRATEFPRAWELYATLLQNVSAVDATIYRTAGRYWMFVGESNGKYSNCDELGLYFADALTGPWQRHPQSPVVSDVRRARPAGRLFVDGGRLIRPSQDCARAYGYATVFSEVITLNETEYEERPLARLEPGWYPGNLGTHTYARSRDWEVIDGNLPVPYPRVAAAGTCQD